MTESELRQLRVQWVMMGALFAACTAASWSAWAAGIWPSGCTRTWGPAVRPPTNDPDGQPWEGMPGGRRPTWQANAVGLAQRQGGDGLAADGFSTRGEP